MTIMMVENEFKRCEIQDKLTDISFKVLCADRLSQMTRTYNDIEAVTRLLEEKERDLELAARIGQTLLDKNKSLEDKNDQLEDLVATAHEKLNQLRHELSMKEELIKIYTQNYESNEPSPDAGESSHVPHLEKKIKSLEEENIQLYLETSKLKNATEGLEEKEQKLVNDCVSQLEESHQQLEQFAKELSEKTEECMTQKQEITDLLHQIVSLQKRIRTITAENLDLQKTLEATQDSQTYLTREIAELKEKNEELLVLLEQAQDDLRHLRNKERPNAVRHNYMSSMLSIPGESLASELESSLRSEIDYPRGYSPMERRKHTWKIFETVKAAKSTNASRADSSVGGPDSLSASMLGTSGLESEDSRSVSQRSSMYFSDGESGVSEGYGGDVESLLGTSKQMGRPGVPGSSDLQRSLRRLSMRRANELNEMDYAREERDRQRQSRTESELTDQSDLDSVTTTGRCQSPDSVLSANSGYMSMIGSGSNPYFRMPEKLRIVKPLEGSVTLRQWQQLAKPHLGGIFESRPGVTIKGEKKLDIEAEVYTLSDYEEDDEVIDFPTRFQHSTGVYTYTDSRVKHPSEAGSEDDADDDDDSVSTMTDDIPMTFSSSTPRTATCERADTSGTTTYSMSLGLASLLNERDLLVTPPERPAVSAQARHRPECSNPARFPSLTSDTVYNPAPTTPTSTLTLPTNNYNLIMTSSSASNWVSRPSQGQYSQGLMTTHRPICTPSTQTLSDRSQQLPSGMNNANCQNWLANVSVPSVSPVPSVSVSSGNDLESSRNDLDMSRSVTRSITARGLVSGNPNDLLSPNSLSTALGVINTLKDKGKNLYGLLYGGKESQDSGAATAPHVGRPGSLPIPSTTLTPPQTSGVPVSNSDLLCPTDSGSGSVSDVQCSKGETGAASTLYTSLFSKKAAGGVLGAIAKFHRDGSL